MTSTEVYLKSDNREEQLLSSVRHTLEQRKYSWHDNPLPFRQGVVSCTTNSLKELLITNSVEMEATTDTNVTALCTVDSEPVDSIESYERLSQFCEDCTSALKTELTQVLYPVFVHIYLDLIAGGHSGMAESFLNKFSMEIGSTHQSEIKELSEVVSAEQVSVSSLAKKFRNQKFFLRMSSKAFQLLMQFLQSCQTPGLLSLIQRYLAIDVYGDTPAGSTEGTGKSEQKRAHSQIFVKPTITQFETIPRVTKGSKGLLQKEFIVPDPSQVVTSSFGKINRGLSSSFEQATSSFTLASSEENSSSTSRAELRERLAVSSQLLAPSPPSVALYTVHTPLGNSAHCASLSSSADVYACGFADSSVHMWSRVPIEASQVTSNRPMRLQSDHHVLRGHHGPVYGVNFDKSGKYLLSSSEDCSTRLWDTHSRCSLVSYRGHTLPVWDTVFSPVDVYFASVSLDRTARLWATDLVFPLRVFAGHTGSVDVVRFHCNGKYIATGSCDQTCRLWDIQTGSCVRLMAGCKSPISSLAFSPNGKQLVSGDEAGTVRIWDLGSGGVVNEYKETTHTTSGARRCPISLLVFSADNTLLVSSSQDNKISIRSMKSLEQPVTAQQVLSKEAISQLKCNVDRLLQLEFTHRNCLVGIGVKSDSPSNNQMDTT